MADAQPFGVAASQGKRKAQEDFVSFTNDVRDASGARPILTVIADGMGGHAAGDVASKLACEQFVQSYIAAVRENSESPLRDALFAANDALGEHVAKHDEADGMGCTLLAVEISQDAQHYRWISVGDSPLLSVTDEGVERLNEDHSFRQLREAAKQAGDDLLAMPSGNVLRSALTGGHVPLIDAPDEWRAFRPGERIVAATDGLDTLKPAQIATIARSSADGVRIANDLIDAVEAMGKPKQDNTTVALLLAPGAQAASITQHERASLWPGRNLPPRTVALMLALCLLLGAAGGGLAVWWANRDAPTAKVTAKQLQKSQKSVTPVEKPTASKPVAAEPDRDSSIEGEKPFITETESEPRPHAQANRRASRASGSQASRPEVPKPALTTSGGTSSSSNGSIHPEDQGQGSTGGV